MNEQDNTALIQRMYDAFSRGDIQTILDSLAPNVEWITEGPSTIPYAETYKGAANVGEFFEVLAATQEKHNLVTHEFIAQGNKVATSGRYAATVKATGKSFDTAIAHVFTIENGKVTRFLDFFDTAAVADAYQAAGSAAGR